MSRRLVYVGDGIGDTLYGLSFVAALNRAAPDRPYGLLSKKRAWLDLLAADFPFEATRGAAGAAVFRCTPTKLRCRQHILEAYLEKLREVDPSAPKRIDLSGFPLWFGPALGSVEKTRDVGVFGYHDRMPNLWPHVGELSRELKRLGARVDVMPAPVNPFSETRSAAEWVSACRAFVGPDTGITHMAAALGVPTVMVLGAKFDDSTFREPSVTYVVADGCPLGLASPCLVWKYPQPCVVAGDRRNRPPYPCVEAVLPDTVLHEVVRRVRGDRRRRLCRSATRGSS